jgi:hypothetical protein
VTTSVLKTQHTSLQFNDDRDQQFADVEKIFKKGKLFPIKTGTESGPEPGNNNIDALRKFAAEYNHVLHMAYGNWIAVDRKIIKAGTLKRGQVFVAKNDIIVGRMHDRVFPTVTFQHEDPRMGRIAQATAHYPTKGARRGTPNFDINQMYARRLQAWMRNASRGTGLSFINGDFNMPDAQTNWAFGGNFTSMADELGTYQNTGHGAIDGFCSYDHDGRVKAKSMKVLDDTEQFMHTDHFVCQGTWTVRHLPTS